MKSDGLLLIGFYGMKNTGDDAMLLSIARGLMEVHPGLHLVIATSSPLTIPAHNGAIVELVERTPVRVICAILRCSSIMWGGGTAIFNYEGRNWKWFQMLLRQYIMFALARLLGKKVFLVGVGLGPFSSGWARFIARKICAVATIITVRDNEALTLLQSWRLRCPVIKAFDLTALLKPDHPRQSQAEKSNTVVVGMSILPYYEIFCNEKLRNACFAERISEAITNVLRDRSDVRIRLFVFKGCNRDHDSDISKSIYDQVGSPDKVEIVPYNPDPIEVLAQVSKCNRFLGMRLHSSIFAYICGLPALVIDYHAKCPIFVDEARIPRDALVSLEEIESGLLAGRLLTLVEEPGLFRAGLPLDEAVDSVWHSLRKVDEYIG